MHARRQVWIRMPWSPIVLAVILMLAAVFLSATPQTAAAITTTGVMVTVTDRVSGEVIPGADIAAYGDDGQAWGVTDATGVCSLDLVPGQYQIQASAEHYADDWTDEIEVTIGPKTPVEMELSPLQKVFTGHVKDVDGDPIPNVRVSANFYDEDEGGWYSANSAEADASGYYELWLSESEPSGPYRIGSERFVADHKYFDEGYYTAAGTVDVVENASDLNRDELAPVEGIDLTLTSEGPSGTFHVVDPDGLPIDLVEGGSDLLNIEDASGADMPRYPYVDTESDGASGKVTVYGLDGGSYVLRLSGGGGWAPQWFDGARSRADATVFSGSPSDPFDLGDWKMMPSVVSISGNVSEAGNPAVDVMVTAYAYDAESGEWVDFWTDFTDDDGNYRFIDLPDGDYRIGTEAWRKDLVAFHRAYFDGANSLNTAKSLTCDGTATHPNSDIAMTPAETVAPDGFEADDTRETAKAIVVGASPQKHTFAPAEDQDWVRFNVTAGTTYTISTGASSSYPVWSELTYASLTLETSDGNPLGFSEDDDHPRLVWTADADRTVYLRVTHTYDRPGAYQLSVHEGVDSTTATIDSVTPNPAIAGTTVTFSGHGTDIFGHAITGYEWAEGDTVLSESASFSTSGLPVGAHVTKLRVQCEDGVWSDAASTTLTVIPAGANPVYRFYNKRNGSHFYTASESEKQNVLKNLSRIYSFDGSAYGVSMSYTTPLHRFYNKKNGSHFYTASESEKQNVLKNLSNTYSYDGAAYNVSSEQVAGSTPVYRFYNKKNGSHFYTASESEKQNVLKNLSKIYSLDGIAFFVTP